MMWFCSAYDLSLLVKHFGIPVLDTRYRLLGHELTVQELAFRGFGGVRARTATLNPKP